MHSPDYVRRRIELVRLLRWAMLPEEGREPLGHGRVSPLIEDEDQMRETAAVLAARHPPFNGQGLGFDIPGTGDWPSVISVGPGGRRLNAEAIGWFFDLHADLARWMVNCLPSEAMIESIEHIDGPQTISSLESVRVH